MVMKKIILLLMACIGVQGIGLAAAKGDPVDLVNPLMGTQSSFALSTGNTYPAIAMPWGMNYWVPQTGKMGDGWQYTYTANKLRGLKQTHQPSPWINDYGQFSVMPTVGEPVFDEDKRASWFSHKAEIARPYYYQVYLADHDVTAEVAPATWAAVMRFTFPETTQANIVVDAFDQGSQVTIRPTERLITGYSTRNSGGVPEGFKNYFAIEFDKPFTCHHVVEDSILHPGQTQITCDHAGAIVTFSTRRGEKITARVASSFISMEQALINLRRLSDDTFDTVKETARECWNAQLAAIEVEDENMDHLRTFYSCLYRTMLFPHRLYEINAAGDTVHYSPYNGSVLHGTLFTGTGFWDTFRSQFPLIDLLHPAIGTQMQEGLVNAYLESGFLPEWASPGHRDCMVGNNSASVVADAYLKGLRGYDIEKLWEAVTHGANAVHPTVKSTGRLGYEAYNRLGYIPYDSGINESVARTLEYAYDDWCIYRLGKALGKPEDEINVYREHSMNYRNVFDPESKLMRGRNADGTFQSPFSPLKWGDAFTEGNSWHYTWSVFHDPQGLMDLMGGRESFCQMLDSVFSVPPLFDDSYYGYTIHEIREMQIMNMGNYAHGNQPIQHMIYLYDYAGEPWKAQYWIQQVMDRMYSATPDGYCGDEDNGQTSAWYVFSALGFYPVCPGSNQYVIGTPYFDHATLRLENGKTVSITRKGKGCYIDAMTVDGKRYTRNYLEHDRLMRGCDICFYMSERPNYRRGTGYLDAPYSLSTTR